MLHIVVIVPRWQSSKPGPPLPREKVAELRRRWRTEAEMRPAPESPIWPGCLFTLLALVALVALIVWLVT